MAPVADFSVTAVVEGVSVAFVVRGALGNLVLFICRSVGNEKTENDIYCDDDENDLLPACTSTPPRLEAVQHWISPLPARLV